MLCEAQRHWFADYILGLCGGLRRQEGVILHNIKEYFGYFPLASYWKGVDSCQRTTALCSVLFLP